MGSQQPEVEASPNAGGGDVETGEGEVPLPDGVHPLPTFVAARSSPTTSTSTTTGAFPMPMYGSGTGSTTQLITGGLPTGQTGSTTMESLRQQITGWVTGAPPHAAAGMGPAEHAGQAMLGLQEQGAQRSASANASAGFMPRPPLLPSAPPTTTTTTTTTRVPQTTTELQLEIDDEEGNEEGGEEEEEEEGPHIFTGSQADEAEAVARALQKVLAWVKLREFADALDHLFGSLPTFMMSFGVTFLLFFGSAGVAPVVAGAAVTIVSFYRWTVHSTDLILNVAAGGAAAALTGAAMTGAWMFSLAGVILGLVTLFYAWISGSWSVEAERTQQKVPSRPTSKQGSGKTSKKGSRAGSDAGDHTIELRKVLEGKLAAAKAAKLEA